jgi:hypothetical protein
MRIYNYTNAQHIEATTTTATVSDKNTYTHRTEPQTQTQSLSPALPPITHNQLTQAQSHPISCMHAQLNPKKPTIQ